MVCTTTLSKHEQNIPTQDDELNSLVSEVRETTGRNWQIEERAYRKGFLWNKKTYYLYYLLVEVGGALPFQIITCVNSAREAKCYLLGILSGYKAK